MGNEYFQCSDTEFVPVHLVYKETGLPRSFGPYQDQKHDVPLTGRDEDYYELINTLDLSNNFYKNPPTIYALRKLTALDLSNNLLETAKLSNKRSLPSLKEIDLSHNLITNLDISRDDIFIFSSLERINLAYNDLEKVPDAIFEFFNNLTYLDVSHNSISSLSPNTFEGIKNLVYLNMSYNHISDINSSLFRFKVLLSLDLSNNLLYNLSNKDFSELMALTNLNLEANFITCIDENTFRNLISLNVLNINDNKLEIIHKDALISSNMLETVLISRNKLNTLPKSLFKGKHIKTFSIIENSLKGSLERGMFEGLNVNVLDLSNQNIQLIDNNAFFGAPLEVLLLQNNNITTLLPKCFNMLSSLKQLDLSNNKISIMAFDKQHLGNLESLSVRNNALTVVKHEFFESLDSLQYLDLSDNKISRLESKSFGSLRNLISFEISNNPLNLTLEENTFEGLSSLPSFDISCTLLATIQNGSFNGMVELKNLNMSHSRIQELQYNSFLHTGFVEILDLSYNEIKQFVINNTQIDKLSILYLDHNFIKSLDPKTFDRMLDLTKIFLSFNEIEKINLLTFDNQKDLQVLDLSNNPKLNFNTSFLNTNRELTALHLSGIKAGMSFDKIGHVPLTDISFANASIVNVQELQLNNLNHLEILDLSKNKIVKVEVGCFANVTAMRTLDLSFNKITYLQSSAFRDNAMLTLLNISHNYLASVSYGMLRGLINLETLDISYNNIDSLQKERFHELRSLSILIADHNRIEDFDGGMFGRPGLSKLSIGNNPIPCKRIVSFLNSAPPFYEITAITLDENNDDNVYGIVCNKNKHTPNPRIPKISSIADEGDVKSILINIRDILSKPGLNEQDIVKRKEEKYLANITNEITKLNEFRNNSESLLINLNNITSQIANKNYTDTLLEKILRLLTMNSLKRPTTPTPITKDNATYDNLVSYINKLKQQLEETIAFEKNQVLNEVENKLSAVSSKVSTPVHENLRLSTSDSESIFTKTCVGLILTILICFVLYKFYKSGMFMRRRFSVSERELPSSMDSPL